MRTKASFRLDDITGFKSSLLLWAKQFTEIVWLDSNDNKDQYGTYDSLLAVDALTSLTTDYQNAFDDLRAYQESANDWLFGYLSYDLKNDIEDLASENTDSLDFADLSFFQPKKLITIHGNSAEFIYLNMVSEEIEADFNEIISSNYLNEAPNPFTDSPVKISMRIFKDHYFQQVNEMLKKIHRGDIYEANFCQEFFAENTSIDPEKTYQKLNSISKTPFAAYLRMQENYLLSASPERYLKKMGEKVISQPIKGTARRSADIKEDEALKHSLGQDIKERSENIMIVDLVRNDLSKSALKGSVHVAELCKIYTFKQVHQMISTIEARVSKDKSAVELLRETFPMGSMTGAPKVSAMKIIEELEASKRGLYSGAVGYFTPEGDFDFNVVIRSILYNAKEKYVSFSVGSAITAKASPENEYQECLLKAKAMREVLEG
ncbi:anthranilate synthase component I family protein [uncultured Eudoraea sp.]|uniref:anthranilate synthase component I family protein n=1 Tax=uncultured Eudoraea sp. TaxID=1035614 RepID=UPI00260C39C6|nr:anthranilate synthase component I family protein [uncultured Eudoraea sp.]